MNSSIIVCGKSYDVGHPVVTFEDTDGYSAYVPHRTDNISEIYPTHPAPGMGTRATRYRARRLLGRSRALSDLRQVVRQMVVHLDGCRDAKECFHVLHNERGLSVHFLVDNDGTIYQTLDLLDCAFHAGGVNEVSIGVELQNRGDAARHPRSYSSPRDIVTCRVHGAQFLAYDFTKAQYEAMIKLGRTLTRVLGIPLQTPLSGGESIWTTIPDVRAFSGFIGHYHASMRKWDPGPWDFKRFLTAVGARVTFPLAAPSDKQVDDEAAAFTQESARHFDNSEQETGAHFPVGPLGESRLWHGGVHLHAPAGDSVVAPLSGTVVAARMGSACSVGSCNFVLLRHRAHYASTPVEFYSLYFHLENEFDRWEDDRAPWFRLAATTTAALEEGATALLAIPVEARDPLGHVGLAGPAGHRRSEIHFAIFSARELGALLDPDHWEFLDGGTTSRFCEAQSLLSRIDRPERGRPRDGLLSRRELASFFRTDARREDLRRLVVRHRAEWTADGWLEQLNRAPDFARLPTEAREELYRKQVAPTLWWTTDVARGLGLPRDGVVYGYHPIGFLVWWRDVLLKQAASRSAQIGSADMWEGRLAPESLTVGNQSQGGMTDDDDYFSGEAGERLTLEDLVDGYPDP